MKTLKDIVTEQHAARAPHDDPLTDRLLTEIMRLGEDVCVLKDRLDTAKRLAAEGKEISDDAIDAYDLAPEHVEERLARHQAWFESVFRRLTDVSESQ